jgi:hypothetical protein
VDEKTAKIISRDSFAPKSEQGADMELIYVGDIMDAAGNIEVRFKAQGLVYGAVYKDLRINTGRILTQALCVKTNCLFRLPGDDENWYLRVLDSSGSSAGNKAVKIGEAGDGYTVVSGEIQEGELCDSGYYQIFSEGNADAAA